MQKIKQSILSIAIGLALVAGISYAWSGATANPPGSNADAPINVSLIDQTFGNSSSAGNKTLNMGNGGGVLSLNGGLSINGIIKITGGVPGAGKVLTATDTLGNATWQPTSMPNIIPAYYYVTENVKDTNTDNPPWQEKTISLGNHNFCALLRQSVVYYDETLDNRDELKSTDCSIGVSGTSAPYAFTLTARGYIGYHTANKHLSGVDVYCGATCF